MKTRIILGFLILLIVFTLPVFAEPLISVKTNANSYKEGEIMIISGKVSTIIPGIPVIMQIFNQGSLADIAQIMVATDGTYSHTIIMEGPLWSKAGEYTVRASFGEGNYAETKFKFSPKTEIHTTNIFEVNIDNNGTFDVKYSIEGGVVKDMSISKEDFELIVIIESTDNGAISLEIPREILDAKKQDKTDETFIIIIDGVEAPYQETTRDSNSRIITINFEKGDSSMEIIGTTVIPEFDTIAVTTLMIGIVAIIAITKKIRAVHTEIV